MTVNLVPAQRAIENLMTDRVRLYRDPDGLENDTLSPEPGNLDLDPGPIAPYYDGRAIVRITEAAEQGASGSLPLAVLVEENDQLEIVESRDPGSVGRWFRVDQVQGGTFSVSRRLVLAGVAAPRGY